MIDKNILVLYDRLRKANKLMSNVTNMEDKMVLANYIGNLYTFIGNVLNIKVKPKKKRIFGDKKGYRDFYSLFDEKEDEMLDNLIRYKEFHCDLIGDIIPLIEDVMMGICCEEIIEDEPINKNDYYNIFMEFMKSLKLDELFLKYLRDGRIHSSTLKEGDTCLAATIYNPFTKDIDMSVSNFSYSVLSMFSMAHEFGHVYDLSSLDIDSKIYNRYFYQSFYGEVYSKLFERLFISYMINNNILKDNAKSVICHMILINHDYLLAAYILSLFDDGYLEDGVYKCMNMEELIDVIKNHFYDEDEVMDYILGVRNLDARDDFTYSYGDIISMFLKGVVEQSGFDNEFVHEFNSIRTNLFRPDFLEKYGINSENYVKLYKNEVGLLQK